MAKRRSNNQSIPASTNRFDKGMNTDVRDYHLDKQSWTHARNAINNSHIGDLGDIGNEPSNKFCSSAPYKIIQAIYMEESRWWIFSGNDGTGSEIGEFNEKDCSYTRIVNDPCLGFRTTHPISGSSRPTHDCSHRVYWQDNLNPDRTLDRADVPWIQDCTDDNGGDPGGCVTCIDTEDLDCDKIRLEVFMTPPCARIERGPAGGSIFNGSYYVHVAYAVNSQKVTDYFPMSNVAHVFENDEANASLDVIIDGLDSENFDEYELVIVQQIANKLSVKKLGLYSTRQSKVTIDIIDPTLEGISANDLLVTNPIADRSEGIFSVGQYLMRTGITSKFNFNYQPLANQIRVKWQAVEYPEDYYKNGGSNVGYPRDEQIAFFVRFRYATGDFSPSYHIPGRAPRMYNIPGASGVQMMEDALYNTVESNNLEEQQGLQSHVFEMFNTASGSGVNTTLPDGGLVVAEGDMGYWQSEEFYNDRKPEVWNATHVNANGVNIGGTTDEDFDLCGKPIRHHKFPENTIYSGVSSSSITNHYVNSQKTIRVMGVKFENIQPPVDNYGNPIPNIVGYEIMRGSRNGNRTVLHKGMINNMRHYTIPEGLNSGRQGYYPNYPFNGVRTSAGSGAPDLFRSSEEVSFEPQTGNTAIGGNRYQNYIPLTSNSGTHHTYHSPDTNFYKPFLGQKELKIYGAMYGTAEGEYLEVEDHPKHVFITDLTFYAGLITGIGLAIAKQVGKKSVVYKKPTWYRYGVLNGSPYTRTSAASKLAQSGGGVGAVGSNNAIEGVEQVNKNVLNFGSALGGGDYSNAAMLAAIDLTYATSLANGSGVTKIGPETSYEEKSSIPPLIAAIGGVVTFLTNIGEGADLLINIVRNASNERQHALQYQAYCGYENFAGPSVTNRRRVIEEAVYLKSHLQNYQADARINNMLRTRSVALNTTISVDQLSGGLRDTTMDAIRVSDLPGHDPYVTFSRQASSHYVGFKSRLRSQYGQVESIQQLPTGCVLPMKNTTGVIFGGDTYIGRYQEKNTFYHFYKWMFEEADRAEFNYHNYDTVQHTAFWMDTEPFNVMEFVSSISTALDGALNAGGSAVQTFFQGLVTPSDKHCFDKIHYWGNPASGVFTVKKSYIYLFHSSVRDFFVESDLNIDMRDWVAEDVKTQHWGVLQDLRTMFRSRNIKAGNYYKLDRSLSTDYLPYAKVAWGKTQDRDYDPSLSETCYTHYPRRLQYSLPQQTLLKRDNWSAFLGNNFKDFSSKVTSIKAVRGTGIMLLFETQSPGMYPGVDELQLKSGTSITVGDGGLFARQMQSISDTDEEFEYGSCQSRKGVINTPAGLFYISQNQGKIFQIGKGLKEISLTNNQHWFNQYLPYQILLDFPDFDLLDNTIAGVGCQALYDNEWGVVYFAKRDFRVKPEYLHLMEYEGNGIFVVDQITRVNTGDPRYFDDASWTVSYDPKTGQEISFHDWHPNLAMSGKNTFLTVKNNGIWRHNKRCDSYCNFYGVDYPWEIEFQLDNLPAVTTLRSVEYFMQVFEFDENCRDRFHSLEFNFDEAVVYNSEQVSGLLKMNLAPKNDVKALKDFPAIGLNQIDIVYSKVEQKYRFNQFWDTTRDRGEFSPTVTEAIWETEPNGYIKNLNPINLNYTKAELQRKKIRHNNNRILLRRTVSGNKKMIMLVNNTKLQNSPR